MPSNNIKLKPGTLKDPEIVELFSTKDPELRYEDLREIGHGAFGSVFYALDKDTREPVAIKKMNFSGKQSSDKWNDIIREVRFLKSLRHPNIVCYKASFLKEQTCWLVMEYCIGSAADVLKVYKKPFLEVEIAAICEKTLKGIDHLHNLKRIHRDIKAGNILLTESGEVKLADLGSASLSSPAQTFVGSPYWMAPEVILAQDSGFYDERADIWSFGITCIELAELKPPLLDMNAYSAMYHIAQNDPPTLQNVSHPDWSELFRSFVDQCLRKDPAQRLSTTACLSHQFVTTKRQPNVILNLISRMKDAVKEQDKSQNGKLRKLICLDDNVENGHLSESCSVGAQEENISNISEEEEVQKQTGHQKEDDISLRNKTVINLDGNGSSTSTNCETNNPGPQSFSIILDQQQIKEEINTLRRSKFSTLRTTRIIAREAQEYQAENNLYEQMCGYKRLRQQHHKELRQIEDRCKIEAENSRLRLDREYEQLYQTCQKELLRLKSQFQRELEGKIRENEDELKKIRKNKQVHFKHSVKSYSACQKREYKHNKEKYKTELKEQGLSRMIYDSALKSVKLKLSENRRQAEQKYMEQQNQILEAELIELRRKQMINYHSVELQLTNNELNIRARQIETLHGLLIKHHEITKEQEIHHLHLIEELKRRHLEVQHDLELNSQRDYNRRALEQQTKEHALQSKQQPRELRAKEMVIRKQFRQAVKIQTRQFKAYQSHMLQLAPKEEHKELLNRMKEEQNRKIAALADQYESTIEKMITDQTFKLDSQQEESLRELTEKLNKELSMLTEYQEKQKMNLMAQLDRDKLQHLDRISLRLAVLKQKMDEEKAQFERSREKQLSQLRERQTLEMNSINCYTGSSNSDDEQKGVQRKQSSHSSSETNTPHQSVSGNSISVEQSPHNESSNDFKCQPERRNSSTNL